MELYKAFLKWPHITLALVLILLTACTSPQATEGGSVATIQVTSTRLSTATPQPTATKLATATVTPTATPVPTTTDPPPTEQLAFVSLQEENAWLYVVNSNGSGLKQVSDAVPRYVPHQQWSPTGSRLAFLAEYQGQTALYTIEKSKSPLRLTAGLDVSSYDWSPNGREIVFEAIREDVDDIYVIALDTLKLANLTSGNSGENREPEWSHDGRHIAFLSVPGAKNIKQSDNGYRIYVMDRNGANKLRVKPESLLPQEQLIECWPAWSPDDRYLAFTHGCTPPDPKNIYMFDLQTGQLSQLTYNDFHFTSSDWLNTWLSNEQLLVHSYRSGIPDYYRVINRDGTNARRFLPWDIGYVQSVDWTSDRSRFVWQEGDANEIVIGDSMTNQVTRTGTKGCSPQWSPSGFWIAYTTECIDKEKSDVWLMDRTGKNQRNLTAQLQGINHFPVWAPK